MRRALRTAAVLTLVVLGADAAGQSLALQAGQTLEREISPGAVDLLQLVAAPGDVISLTIEPQQAALTVTLADGSGVVLAEAEDATGDTPLRLSAVADAAGPFDLKLTASAARPPGGRYRVVVAPTRPASDADRQRVETEKLQAQAARLAQQRSVEARRQALESYRAVRERWRLLGDRRAEAEATSEIAQLHFDLGEAREALAPVQEALALYESDGYRRGQVETLNNLAMFQAELGDPASAIQILERALSLDAESGGVRLRAIVLNNIGALYRDLGDPRTALDCYRRALPLRRQAADRKGEATTLSNIGVASRMLGERDQALAAYEQALSLARSGDDRVSEAAILLNVGTLAVGLGDIPRGVEALERARDLNRTLGDVRSEAYVLGTLGLARQRAGEPDQALDLLGQALALHRRIGDRYWEGYTLHQIGIADRASGRLPEAREALSSALEVQRAVGDRFGQANTLLELAASHRDEGDSTAARAALDQALTLTRATPNPNAEASVLYRSAQLRRTAGDVEGALQDARDAATLQESLRVRVAGSDWRASYFVRAQEIYEFQVDLLMSQAAARPAGDELVRRALEASERKRARALLDALAESKAHIVGDADPELRRRETQLEDRLRTLLQRQTRLLARADRADQAAAVAREIQEVTDRSAEVTRELQAGSPAYAALLLGAVADSSEIQGLLDEDTVLLEFSLGPEASYGWAVTRGSVEGVPLPGRERLARAAHAVWEALGTAPGARRRRSPATEALAALSRVLLGPLAGRLERGHVVIVADDVLQHVPYAALLEPAGGPHAGRPLASNHTITLLPSASILKALRARSRPARPSKGVVVLADPVFEPDDPRVGRRAPSGRPADLGGDAQRAARDVGLAGSGGALPRLAFSRREAHEIAALAPAGGVMRALDFDASRATALSAALREFRIVHFATHALVDNERPERSGIVLSLLDREGRAQDGFLSLSDVYNLRLSAELVVLSACRTAIGKELRGEGLMSLVRAFMYAGTPRVVASLWNVEDRATAALMKEFYRGLLAERLAPAEALRRAQLAIRAHARWRDPYYWAGFALEGDWK